MALSGAALGSGPQGKDPTGGWTSDLWMISCLEGATNTHSIFHTSWKANCFPKKLPFELVNSSWKNKKNKLCTMHVLYKILRI